MAKTPETRQYEPSLFQPWRLTSAILARSSLHLASLCAARFNHVQRDRANKPMSFVKGPAAPFATITRSAGISLHNDFAAPVSVRFCRHAPQELEASVTPGPRLQVDCIYYSELIIDDVVQ